MGFWGFGGKCLAFVCDASDIRLVENAHHVIVDSSFKERVEYKEHNKPGAMGDNLYKTDKIHCLKCGYDWGVGAMYRDEKVPVIKAGQFVIEKDGSKKMPMGKKWASVDFKFIDMPLDASAELASE